MSKARLIRFRSKKRSKNNAELDITSLLDIITILLVFLIQNYNESPVSITFPDDIKIPSSKSIEQNNTGIKVIVSPSKIWVEDRLILDSNNLSSNTYSDGGQKINPLYDELVRKREEISAVNKTIPGSNDFTGVANLVIDKEIKYNYIKKIMYTTAMAGFKQYKFVVLGE